VGARLGAVTVARAAHHSGLERQLALRAEDGLPQVDLDTHQGVLSAALA
jgi:hypothetical protein